MSLFVVMSQIVFFIGTFLVVPFLIYHLIKKNSPQLTALMKMEIIISALGIGPALIALFLFFLLLIFPHQKTWFYPLIIFLVFTGAAFCIRKEIIFFARINLLWLKFLQFFRKISIRRKVVLVLAVVLTVYVIIQGVIFPISGHDASVYAQYGRYLYEEKSLNNYPMSQSDPKTGFYFTGAQHPPGLPLIYTWFYLLQGQSYLDVLPRMISPFYAILFTILIYFVLKKRKSLLTADLGLLLIAITPLFIWQAYDNTIDPPRLFFILLSLVFIGKFIEKQAVFPAIFGGMALGFTLFFHSSGILIALASILAYFLLFPGWGKEKWKYLAVVVVIAFLIGGFQYVINYQRFSNILGPSSYNLFSTDIKSFYAPTELSRVGLEGKAIINNTIAIPKDLIFGRLQIFSRPELFGLSFLIMIFSLVWWLNKKEKTVLDKVMFALLVICFIPIFYKFYTNRRYFLTVFPMVLYFDALYLESLWEKMKQKKLQKYFFVLAGVLIAIILIGLLGPTSIVNQRFQAGSFEKLKYYLSDKKTQNNILGMGVFEAIEFINKLPEQPLVLTTDDARYFYYANKKGVYWQSPEIACLNNPKSKEEIRSCLKDKKIGYILLDPLNGQLNQDFYKILSIFCEDQNFATKVFDGQAKVYKLN